MATIKTRAEMWEGNEGKHLENAETKYEMFGTDEPENKWGRAMYSDEKGEIKCNAKKIYEGEIVS